ncbi:unnamed protein product, partial [Ilex paraguariensis]
NNDHRIKQRGAANNRSVNQRTSNQQTMTINGIAIERSSWLELRELEEDEIGREAGNAGRGVKR